MLKVICFRWSDYLRSAGDAMAIAKQVCDVLILGTDARGFQGLWRPWWLRCAYHRMSCEQRLNVQITIGTILDGPSIIGLFGSEDLEHVKWHNSTAIRRFHV